MNEPRRLYRSADDRMIAGVAGGLAEYYNLDPVVVRILWAISVPVTGFLTAFVYLVMMVVVPLEGPAWPASPAAPGSVPPTPGASGGPADSAASSAASAASSAQPSYAWEARGQRRASSGGITFGIILIVVGGLFAWHEVDPRIDLSLAWPLAIVALGVLLVLTSVGAKRGE